MFTNDFFFVCFVYAGNDSHKYILFFYWSINLQTLQNSVLGFNKKKIKGKPTKTPNGQKPDDTSNLNKNSFWMGIGTAHTGAVLLGIGSISKHALSASNSNIKWLNNDLKDTLISQFYFSSTFHNENMFWF